MTATLADLTFLGSRGGTLPSLTALIVFAVLLTPAILLVEALIIVAEIIVLLSRLG